MYPLQQFPKSLCIKIPSKINHSINRKIILKSLHALMKQDIHQVEYISQQINNYTWQISFHTPEDCVKWIDSVIHIEGEAITIEDFSQVSEFRFITYKVLWLPHKFPKEKIEKFFNHDGIVSVQATEETISNLDIEGLKVKTGNWICKLKIKRENKNFSLSSGISSIDNRKIFISKFGEKPRCLRCQGIGHIRKNCDKFKKTYANTVAQISEENPDEDDPVEEKSESNVNNNNQENIMEAQDNNNNKYNNNSIEYQEINMEPISNNKNNNNNDNNNNNNNNKAITKKRMNESSDKRTVHDTSLSNASMSNKKEKLINVAEISINTSNDNTSCSSDDSHDEDISQDKLVV